MPETNKQKKEHWLRPIFELLPKFPVYMVFYGYLLYLLATSESSFMIGLGDSLLSYLKGNVVPFLLFVTLVFKLFFLSRKEDNQHKRKLAEIQKEKTKEENRHKKDIETIELDKLKETNRYKQETGQY